MNYNHVQILIFLVKHFNIKPVNIRYVYTFTFYNEQLSPLSQTKTVIQSEVTPEDTIILYKVYSGVVLVQ